MAGLLGIYSHGMKVEDVGFYSAIMMRFLGHRGSRSAKASCGGLEKVGDQLFMEEGWQKEFFYKAKSPAIAAVVSKRTQKSMAHLDPGVFIDGYVKDGGTTGMYDKNDMGRFEAAFVEKVAGGDYADAMDLANSGMNGTLVMQAGDKLVGLRTATGYKQLFHVAVDEGSSRFEALVSEDGVGVLFDKGAAKIRPVKPGQIVVVDGDGMSIRHISDDDVVTGEKIAPGYDHHEALYTLHNDSTWNGKSVNAIRKEVGASLFKMYEDDFRDVDIVSYVPDEPITMALGFSRESGKMFEEVLSKNRYEGGYQQRDYEALGENQRRASSGAGGQIKLMVTSDAMVSGKEVVVIDDSIIRGGHTRTTIDLLRGAGAKVRFVSSEIPIVDQRQVGIYTEDINGGLVARKAANGGDVRILDDFNRMMSEKYKTPVYYNSLTRIAEVVGARPEDLDVPGWIRNIVS